LVAASALLLACGGAGSSGNGAGGDAAASSSGGGGSGRCIPGDTVACQCSDGTYSLQECTAEGGLSACECGLDPLDPRIPHGDAGAQDAGAPDVAADGNLGAGVTLVLLPGTAIVADPSRELFYLATESDAPGYPNAVAALSPDGSVAWSVAFDATPGSLAIADDGSELYVGFPTEPTVRRVSLATHQVDLTIPLTASQGAAFAWTIEAVPGNPHSCVVGTHGYGLVVFDDATARSVHTFDTSGGTPGSWDAFHLASATVGYQIQAGGTYANLYPLALSGTGIVENNGVVNAFGASTPDFALAAGLAYGFDGTVIDPTTGTMVGHFDVGGEIFPGGWMGNTVIVGEANDAAQDYPIAISVYAPMTYMAMATHTIPSGVVVGTSLGPYAATLSPSGILGILDDGAPPGRLRQHFALLVNLAML
jgi:hypothetical protein